MTQKKVFFLKTDDPKYLYRLPSFFSEGLRERQKSLDAAPPNLHAALICTALIRSICLQSTHTHTQTQAHTVCPWHWERI